MPEYAKYENTIRLAQNERGRVVPLEGDPLTKSVLPTTPALSDPLINVMPMALARDACPRWQTAHRLKAYRSMSLRAFLAASRVKPTCSSVWAAVAMEWSTGEGLKYTPYLNSARANSLNFD